VRLANCPSDALGPRSACSLAQLAMGCGLIEMSWPVTAPCTSFMKPRECHDFCHFPTFSLNTKSQAPTLIHSNHNIFPFPHNPNLILYPPFILSFIFLWSSQSRRQSQSSWITQAQEFWPMVKTVQRTIYFGAMLTTSPTVRANLSSQLKYSQHWSGVCAGVLQGVRVDLSGHLKYS